MQKDLGHKSVLADGYVNQIGNLGFTGSNVESGGFYLNNYLTRAPHLLRALYRTSFVIRKVCDIKADDSTKTGIRLDTDIPPDTVDSILEGLVEKSFWDQLANTIRWSYLFGTAFLMPVIDGQDESTPLNLQTIGKNQLKGWMVLDRWQVVPKWGEGRITTMGPNVGYPVQYQTIPGNGIPVMSIHHSRMWRIDATPLPWIDRYTENFFSASVCEAIFDVLKGFDQSSHAAVGLIEAARNDVIYTDRLPDTAAQDSTLYGRLTAKAKELMRFRTNQGLTFLGTDEKLERYSTSAISGVSEVIERMAEQVAGATGIPLCKLLGKSTGGLNAGDDDLLDQYYQDIGAFQNTKLKTLCKKAVYAESLSQGIMVNHEDLKLRFNPLRNLKKSTQAELAERMVNTLTTAYNTGEIPGQVYLKELKQLSGDSGLFTNLSDEDIEAASMEPPKLEMTETPEGKGNAVPN